VFPSSFFPNRFFTNRFWERPLIIVVTGGGGGRARIAHSRDEYLALLNQIKRDDDEILTIIIAAVCTGRLP
jgi:hypothetical protein